MQDLSLIYSKVAILIVWRTIVGGGERQCLGLQVFFAVRRVVVPLWLPKISNNFPDHDDTTGTT